MDSVTTWDIDTIGATTPTVDTVTISATVTT